VSPTRVDDLVAAGALRRVEPDRAAAQRELATARQHLESARTLSGADETGALSMAYDAARKAIAAHMRAHGLRVGRGEGGHARMGEYGVAVFGDSEWSQAFRSFNRVRQVRNRSQYDAFAVEDADVQFALAQAEAIVTAVAGDLE
jgi:hypothetical protein